MRAMRRLPRHIWALLLVVPFTIWGVIAAFTEGNGPFDDHTTFGYVRLIERQELGYTNASQYGYWTWSNHFFSYCVWDDPYQPGTAPAQVGTAPVPLPPLVERHGIYGVAPELILLAVLLAWVGWAALFIRWWRTVSEDVRGFDVSPHA
jgi:hypothetical protein